MAGAGVNLPPTLRLDGNSCENWARFKRHFKVYLGASGNDTDVSKKAADEKRTISKNNAKLLLNLAGENAIDLASSFGLPDEDMNDFDTLVAAFDNYFVSKKDNTYDRFKFNQRVQQEGETFDQFLNDAKRLLESCGYDYFVPHETMLRDKIVMGICDKKVQKGLLQLKGLTLEGAIHYCREAEQADHSGRIGLSTVIVKQEQSDSDNVLSTTASASDRDNKEEFGMRKRQSGMIDRDYVSKKKKMLLEEKFQKAQLQLNGTESGNPEHDRMLSSSDGAYELLFRQGEYSNDKSSFQCNACFLQCLSRSHFKQHELTCSGLRIDSEPTKDTSDNEKHPEDLLSECEEEDFSGSDESTELQSDSTSSEDNADDCDPSAHLLDMDQRTGTSLYESLESTTLSSDRHCWGPCVGGQPYFEFTGCEQVYLLEDRNSMKPSDMYQVFVSDRIVDDMVEEINTNAANYISSQQIKRPGRFNSWSTTHREEVKTFIGLRIWMSLVQMPRFTDYWSDCVVYQNGVAKKAMSRTRFLQLLRFWHFRKNNPDKEGLYVHPILEKLQQRFVDVKTPGERLVLEEHVVPVTPGETVRLHTPLESDIYGKKEFRISDPSGYTYRMMVFSGRGSSEESISRTAAQLIMTLMEPYLDCGRIVCTDNSYTSMELIQNLRDRKTHFLGPVDKTARGFPKEVMNARLRKGQVVAMESKLNGATVLKWRNEREIRMVSTKFSAVLTSLGRKTRNGEDAVRPEMVLEYKKLKSSMDVVDVLSSFSCAHSASVRWYHKLVDDALFYVSLTNALLIWNKTKPDGARRMTLLQFGREVCQQFLSIPDDPYERTTNPTTHYLGQAQELQGAKSRRKARGRCRGCYKELMKTLDRKEALSKVKRVSTQCITCPDKPYLCMPCFKNVHESPVVSQ